MTVGDEAKPPLPHTPKNSDLLSILGLPVRRLDVRPAPPAHIEESDDACDGAGEGNRLEREGRHAHGRAAGGDGQVQRGTAKGRSPEGRRRAEAHLEGQARGIQRRKPYGDRRAVRRGQGAGRRLLDLGREGPGRGGRLGEALPQPDAGAKRDRDPAVLRGGGFPVKRRTSVTDEGPENPLP